MNYSGKALLTLSDAIKGYHNREKAFEFLKTKYDPELYCLADAVVGFNSREKAMEWLKKNNYPELVTFAEALYITSGNEYFLTKLRDDDYPELAALAELITGQSWVQEAAANWLKNNDYLKLYHLGVVISGFSNRDESVKWLFDNEN